MIQIRPILTVTWPRHEGGFTCEIIDRDSGDALAYGIADSRGAARERAWRRFDGRRCLIRTIRAIAA